MTKKILLLSLILVFTVSFVVAQSGQTGAIKGTVTSPEGSVLPGISVTLRSPSMVIDKKITITNAQGKYRHLSLAPGKYQLTFELDGMNTIVREGIVVSANVNASVDIKMQFKTVTEQIVVKGQAPTIDRQSTTNTATLDEEFLNSIPASRSVGTYFNMTPGVTGDSSQGSSVRDNSYSLDGVQMNDPVVGTDATAYGMEIMEEVSVQTGGLSAEYGSVKGSVVNVITKSGGNNFSGSASFYLDHEKLKGDNTKGTPFEGSLTGAKYNYEPGVTLGGPVLKDKLWFFTNFSLTRSEKYYAGFPYDQEESIPRKWKSMSPYFKFTYQPSQADKFVIGLNYNKDDADHVHQSQYRTADTTRSYRDLTVTLSVQWTHNFGDNLLTNLKIGAYRFEMDYISHNQEAAQYSYNTYRYTGGYGFDDINVRDRIQGNFDGTLFLDDLMGDHEVKFGIQATLGRGIREITPYGPEDPFGLGYNRVKEYYYNGHSYSDQYYANHKRESDVLNVGIFLTDTWSVTKKITFNLGLRFDYNKNFFPPHGDDVSTHAAGDMSFLGYPDATWNMQFDESITAFSWSNFSPRFGIIYDLFSDGSTIIKAGLNKYLQDNFATISFSLHPANWVGFHLYTDDDHMPYAVRGLSVPGTDAFIGYNDYEMKAPYALELTLGIERELWEDWSVGLRYTRRWDKRLVEDVSSASLNIDKLMETGEFEWSNYTPYQVLDPHDGKYVTMWDQEGGYIYDTYYFLNPPGADRDYQGVEFTLNKRYSKNWSLMLSYVFNKSEGLVGNTYSETTGAKSYFDTPNTHVNAYGSMPLERRHQFKINALVKGPLGINMSCYFRYLSGRAYGRIIDTQYLENVTFVEDTAVYAEAPGAYFLPDLAILDLRVEKMFRFGKRMSVRFFADIFNVFNTNTTTGVHTDSSNPEYTFGEASGIYSRPRTVRLGGKFEF
ncbi:MAG: TonB-dependent receptor [bacterium]|nr:TonB-dependent receptor [bacterium]